MPVLIMIAFVLIIILLACLMKGGKKQAGTQVLNFIKGLFLLIGIIGLLVLILGVLYKFGPVILVLLVGLYELDIGSLILLLLLILLILLGLWFVRWLFQESE